MWESLDSFWREKTAPSTRLLVEGHAQAAALAHANVMAKLQHVVRGQSIETLEDGMRLPWLPLILYRSALVEQSVVLYGDGWEYADPPQILYGDPGAVSRTLLTFERPFIDIPYFCDSINHTTVVIDPSQFIWNRRMSRVEFSIDPFDILPVQQDDQQQEFVLLWMRNPVVDIQQPFRQVGWPLRYRRNAGDRTYTQTVKRLWESVLLGPSLNRLQRGLLDATGMAYARTEGWVVDVVNNGVQTLVVDSNGEVYTENRGNSLPLVSNGDKLMPGNPIFDAVQFWEYPETESIPYDRLPGFIFNLPLSTGSTATLAVSNTSTEWSFDALRSSPYRFDIGGDPQDVEQFWTDLDATGVDLGTELSLSPGDTVNPFVFFVQHVLRSNLFVATVDLNAVARRPAALWDRLQPFLPATTNHLLQQTVGMFDDRYPLEDETSDSVTYGYNHDAATEVISVSGTDLTYFDYMPMVSIS